MDKYSDQVKIENVLILRDLLEKLPKFCDEYFQDIKYSTAPRTKTAYARDLLQFFQYIVNNKDLYQDYEVKDLPFDVLNNIKKDDLTNYMDYLSFYEVDGKEFKNETASIARKLSSISKLFKYFHANKRIENNPVAALTRPKINKNAVIALNDQQIEMLLQLVKNPIGLTDRQKAFHPHTVVRDFAILTVFLGTGIRVSELVGLNVTDIDFYNSTLKVTRKGGDEEYVYFGQAIKNALKSYLDVTTDVQDLESILNNASPRDILLKKNKEEPALFLSLRGTRLTVRSVEILVKKYSEMLQTNKKITPHKLRSTYGTSVYNATGDIYLIAELLNHKGLQTVTRYVSVASERKKNVVDVTLPPEK